LATDGLTKRDKAYEAETIICWNEAENEVIIFTASKKAYQKIAKEEPKLKPTVVHMGVESVTWEYKLKKNSKAKKLCNLLMDDFR